MSTLLLPRRDLAGRWVRGRTLGVPTTPPPWLTTARLRQDPPASTETADLRWDAVKGLDERGVEWKAMKGGQTLEVGDGEALIIGSVTGVLDRVNDVIAPGVYQEALAERWPKTIHAHDWTIPTGKCLEIQELLPGDSRLPDNLPDGTPWPAAAGALVAHIRFNLGTERGRDAYSDCQFYGTDQEWSIGYKTLESTRRPADGARYIAKLTLFELSDVLWGAMPWARTLSIAEGAA